MNKLSNSILSFYLEHFDELPSDKRFHFASRLYLWSQHDELHTILERELRAEFTGEDDPTSAFRAICMRVQENKSHGSKNASELRMPYFEKYPNLKLYVSLLFRLLFLETIYGIDARNELRTFVSDEELANYASALWEDDDAIAILSTHAINFLYLYHRVLNQDTTGLDPARFLAIGRRAYDMDDLIHLQLLVYLYTHCIIGESRFYYQRPSQHITIYHAMLEDLTQLITERYDDINLDNKCEYLVCCELLSVTSPLQKRIFSEAEDSVSEHGTFIIDRHNNNPQTTNTTLDLSEHRNVLFILANQPFRPLG